ncbi:MAG: T9SS type A sorting domain-containing protein [bacterium]
MSDPGSSFRLVKALLISFLLAAFMHSAAAAQTEYVLETRALRVVVDLETGGIAGIEDTRRLDSPLVFEPGADILEIAAGEFQPFGFLVTQSAPDSVTLVASVFLSETGHLPLRVSITYRVTENRLSADYCFEALGRVEFDQGLEINLSSAAWDSILVRNHYSGEPPVVCAQAGGPRNLGWNQVYELRGSARDVTLVFPNPYQSMVTIETPAPPAFLFSWHVLRAREPLDAADLNGPPLASVLARGIRLRRQIELIVTHEDEAYDVMRPIAYFSPFPDGYDQIISIIFDDIPFGGDPPTSGHDPDSKEAQYLVRLLEDHPRMKMGWVVRPDPIWSDADIANPDYPPGKWWLAHSKRRLLTYYDENYHQWIRNLERDSLVYGYEDQVHLGSHGYHHVPEREYAPNQEFQYYDPTFDDSTFAAIVREYGLLGLHAKSRRFIRFPGLAFTRSTVDALIKNEFIFFDYWVRDTHGETALPFLFFYSEFGRIWGACSWWNGDPPSPYEIMEDFLKQGKICITNGHPYATFDRSGDSEAAYVKIESYFSRAEAEFANLGYMFPDDIGYFADETYGIHDFKSEIICGAFGCSFRGSATLGQTLVVEWPDGVDLPREVAVDGLDIASPESRGRRLLVYLPPLAEGPHSVRMSPVPGDSCSQNAPGLEPVLYQNEPNPFRSETFIRYWLPRTDRVKLTVYDLLGRRVAVLVNGKRNAGINVEPWDGRNGRGTEVASGVYFCRLELGGSAKTQMRKLTLIR